MCLQVVEHKAQYSMGFSVPPQSYHNCKHQIDACYHSNWIYAYCIWKCVSMLSGPSHNRAVVCMQEYKSCFQKTSTSSLWFICSLLQLLTVVTLGGLPMVTGTCLVGLGSMRWYGTSVMKDSHCKEVIRDSVRPMDSGQAAYQSASGTMARNTTVEVGCLSVHVLLHICTDMLLNGPDYLVLCARCTYCRFAVGVTLVEHELWYSAADLSSNGVLAKQSLKPSHWLSGHGYCTVFPAYCQCVLEL